MQHLVRLIRTKDPEDMTILGEALGAAALFVLFYALLLVPLAI